MSNTPTYKAKSFLCPHCGVNAQQQWFDVAEGANTTFQLIQHIYFEYRTGIRDYEQNAISGFLDSIEHDFKSTFRNFIPEKIAVYNCFQCGEPTLWVKKELVFPKTFSAFPPNPDLTPEIIDIYNEAASIFTDSPRGAAALLRLALQKLLKQLGKKGKNINQDIKELKMVKHRRLKF